MTRINKRERNEMIVEAQELLLLLSTSNQLHRIPLFHVYPKGVRRPAQRILFIEPVFDGDKIPVNIAEDGVAIIVATALDTLCGQRLRVKGNPLKLWCSNQIVTRRGQLYLPAFADGDVGAAIKKGTRFKTYCR